MNTTQIGASPSFAQQVIAWQRLAGRHHLPWQNTKDAYLIWLSEIMLQQTQVAAVIPFYVRFLLQFPNFQTLASAPADAVLAAWAGLGYYSRARNLHQCAKQIMTNHQGQFPRDVASAVALPGIGRSTAAAILSFAYGQPLPILDANVKRVFCRYFGVDGDPTSAHVTKALWSIAQREVPSASIQAYNQGLMDLGATICTPRRPSCPRCPVSGNCVALQTNRVDELPIKKRRTLSPTRKPVFLMVMQDQSIWLERQPAPGIWAGLYSLPRLIDDLTGDESVGLAIENWLAQKSWEALKIPTLKHQFKHAFTHFKLDAQCWQVEVGGNALIAAQPGRGFYSQLAREKLGLPKPIQTLLKKPVCLQEID